jgi:Peptidase A4 family
VNFIGVDGLLHELYIRPGQAQWSDNSLTDLGGGQDPPVAGSALSGYWGSGNGQHVSFIGADGHVREMYKNPEVGWQNDDVTAFAGGGTLPATGTALDSYWGSNGTQHVNFIDTDGHLREMYTDTSLGRSGQITFINVFTEQFFSITLGSPPSASQNGNTAEWIMECNDGGIPGASLPAFTPVFFTRAICSGPDGATGQAGAASVFTICGFGATLTATALGPNEATIFYIGPTNWTENDLTNLANATAPAPGTSLHSYAGTDGSQHGNFIGVDGLVHELYVRPGQAQWSDNPLTTMAGATKPAPGTALDGYWGSDSSQHVNFIGVDGLLHELYIRPGQAQWKDNPLTTLSGNPITPVTGSALSAYWRGDSSQHVNFIGIDAHVHEMYNNPETGHWQDNDLTGFAGSTGTPPAAGAALDSYWGIDGTQHVNFIGADGHVHEIYTRNF